VGLKHSGKSTFYNGVSMLRYLKKTSGEDLILSRSPKTTSTPPTKWVSMLGQDMASVANTSDPTAFPVQRLTLPPAGRGVLLDIWSHTHHSYDPFTSRPITLAELHACATAQNTSFQPGDILILRTGWVPAYHALPPAARESLGRVKNFAHTFVGVEQTEGMLDFLHDGYFSAVAGDQPGFECWPPGELSLHRFLLPLWGVPIGEMWDLERLAEVCREKGQYGEVWSCSFSFEGRF